MYKYIILICIGILSGCEKDDADPVYKIPSDYKFDFGERTQLIYKSSDNLFDTFGIYIYRGSEHLCNTDFESYVWSEKCWFEESSVIHIYPYNKEFTSTRDSLFTLQLRKEKMSEPNFSYSIYSLDYRFGDGHNGQSKNDSVELIRINDWNYYAEVFTCRDTSASNIRKIYCLSNYGVLRYELANGEWWELQID